MSHSRGSALRRYHPVILSQEPRKSRTWGLVWLLSDIVMAQGCGLFWHKCQLGPTPVEFLRNAPFSSPFLAEPADSLPTLALVGYLSHFSALSRVNASCCMVLQYAPTRSERLAWRGRRPPMVRSTAWVLSGPAATAAAPFLPRLRSSPHQLPALSSHHRLMQGSPYRRPCRTLRLF